MRVWLVEQGNFAEVVFSVIEPRMKRRAGLPGPPITIRQVNDLLDRLAAADSTGEKTEVMHEIIQQTTAREQRWILRVILKDMQLGMKEDSVFKLLHPDAKELYASVCDLRATCEQCVDPSYRCVRRCPTNRTGVWAANPTRRMAMGTHPSRAGSTRSRSASSARCSRGTRTAPTGVRCTRSSNASLTAPLTRPHIVSHHLLT